MTRRFASVSGKARPRVARAAACVLMLTAASGRRPGAGRGAPPPPPDPNPGALTFTGNVDMLGNTPYIFRGIVQESEPQFTLWPAGDLGIALYSGKQALKSASLNFGVWNSLQTGSSGLDGPNKKLHYEEDFYTSLGLTFSKATFTTTYTAYTSPNAGFGTVHEIAIQGGVDPASSRPTFCWRRSSARTAPTAARTRAPTSNWASVRAGRWARAKRPWRFPVKVGLSAHNYYELNGVDNKFGFFDVGALLTVPLSGIPASYGAWNFHVGGDVFAFGDTTKAINAGKSAKGVFLFGFGVGY